MRYVLAFLLLATLPASAQSPTVTCPQGTVPNPSYTASPLTQAPCVAIPPPAPIYVAPPAPVYTAPAIDPTFYWLQQQQIQQMQQQEQLRHWQWEHMQHPDHPDHH